jgi:hypothetical protein
MLDNLSQTLRKYANGWLVLVFLAGEIFFTSYYLPGVQAEMIASSGGNGPIDLLFFYTPAEVFSMVDSYGEDGRASYLTHELTIDVIYPIVYTLFFALLITWLFQRGFSPGSRMQKLNVVPFGAFLFDMLENVCIMIMLSAHPSQPVIVAWLGTVFTMIKWLFAVATILLILTGLVMALRNKFKKQ